LVRASVFTVTEGRLAIKSIGGEIVDSNLTPGLHFRIPLVQEVALFDKRIITQLYPAERFLTREPGATERRFLRQMAHQQPAPIL